MIQKQERRTMADAARGARKDRSRVNLDTPSGATASVSYGGKMRTKIIRIVATSDARSTLRRWCRKCAVTALSIGDTGTDYLVCSPDNVRITVLLEALRKYRVGEPLPDDVPDMRRGPRRMVPVLVEAYDQLRVGVSPRAAGSGGGEGYRAKRRDDSSYVRKVNRLASNGAVIGTTETGAVPTYSAQGRTVAEGDNGYDSLRRTHAVALSAFVTDTLRAQGLPSSVGSVVLDSALAFLWLMERIPSSAAELERFNGSDEGRLLAQFSERFGRAPNDLEELGQFAISL